LRAPGAAGRFSPVEERVSKTAAEDPGEAAAGTHPESLEPYLRPTWFLDSDSPAVVRYAQEAIGDASTDRDKAVRLFYRVRDGIRYNPYLCSGEREAYRASAIAQVPAAFCVPKAILLAAAARASGVPSRLGFADVRNHLTTPQLRKLMRTDIFVFHGFTEFHLGGRWVKATSAFNLSLCERFGLRPLEFDGRSDSLYHPFDAQGRRHMEYVRDRGTFADFPFEEMVRVLKETYGSQLSREEAARVRDPAFETPD
jgi:transglutaminase-like putative cysteine protease